MVSYGRITTTASYVPPKIVTNNDLTKIMDTSDEWIYSRTGIKERHMAVNENTSDLCLHVAKSLLKKANKPSEELDFIIVATMTPDFHTPSVACIVQGSLGAANAFAFDISVACTGFVYALSLGNKLIQTGANCGLVIGGEVLTKMLDWEDRSTAVLFGDAAAGVLLEASEEPMILNESLCSDGLLGQALTSGFVEADPLSNKPKAIHPLRMEGRAIFDFATRTVVRSVRNLMQDEQTPIDYFLLHQANVRILDIFSRKLNISREKFLQNMQKYGNTSAATIPLLLDEAVTDGTIVLGSQQRIMMTGFGGGLTWGNLLLQV